MEPEVTSSNVLCTKDNSLQGSFCSKNALNFTKINEIGRKFRRDREQEIFPQKRSIINRNSDPQPRCHSIFYRKNQVRKKVQEIDRKLLY